MARQFRQLSNESAPWRPVTRTAGGNESETVWSVDGHLAAVERQLRAVQDHDFIIVVGHHPIGGGGCGAEGDLRRLRALLELFRVSAYLCGHVHALEYSELNGITYVLSGAGGYSSGRGCAFGGTPEEGRSRRLWQRDHVGGFAVLLLTEDGVLTVEFIGEDGSSLFVGGPIQGHLPAYNHE